jgi:mannose-6-phosphate isomerase-like protein (cupin superfamily)
MTVLTDQGAVVRAQDLVFATVDGAEVATAVGPIQGAQLVRLDVIRIPRGVLWSPANSIPEENVVVILAGAGSAWSGIEHGEVGHTDALYAPTGNRYALRAESEEGLIAYVWRSRLEERIRRRELRPRRWNSLWSQETQLRGFSGTGQAPASERTATMNFLFWPGTGSPRLCLHCGVMSPGEYFNVHVHPQSEEAFMVIEGSGQLYLKDRWIDSSVGDVLYAPPGVPHGTRFPDAAGATGRFVTCGGPTPFDPALYDRAGVSAQVR